MSRIVADQIVDMLVEIGVKRFYAVTGDSLNHLNDAIRRSGIIKWIHVRHEEVGAFAAAAEAELNGIAACGGSSGPGHIHLINGLYEANRTRVPVLAIAATIPSPYFGVDYFQSTNTIKLFDDCSIYNQVIQTREQAPQMLQTAIQHAIHRRGVAVLGLPGDIAALPAIESIAAMHNYAAPAVLRPIDSELERTASLLNKAPKVTIYCGYGAREAHDEVIQLAGKLQAPVGYTFRGKMSIQYNNPNEVGMTGLLGLPSAYHSMHEADVVLLLGTDFPYTPFMPTKNMIIQVDESPELLGRRAKLEIGLCGHIKDTVNALLPLIAQKSDDGFLKGQLQFYGEVKKHLNTYVADSGSSDKIQPEFATSVIDRLAADDAIFSMDSGMCCVWAARYIHATGKRRFLGSFNHGSMANAMPMAIGASLLYPDRPVIAFCGDGGLSMLLGDLGTIHQYNLPIKIFVFNNRALGMVKLEMEVQGIPDNETDINYVDFAGVAEAIGFQGFTVHEPAKLEETVAEALAHEGPVLVDILTNPFSLALPPKLEWEQTKGYMLAMTKMMLGGRMDEVLEMIRSNYRHLNEVV
jgi:pyruvate dehydrogenase (quinone)